MIDIRQSSLYSSFIEDLGWNVEKVGRWNAFVRKFPLIGTFIKIQKIQSPIPFTQIEELRKKYKAFKVQVALDIAVPNIKVVRQFTDYQFHIDSSPNIPTQTIHIDLTQSENMLFNNFTEAKRRAVRRAINNGVTIKITHDIQPFVSIRKKQNFPMGFLLVREMAALWKNFSPKNAIVLLAYTNEENPIAGVFLLFFDHVAYYWYASSALEGKKLFAPTLLVWEAIKLAKKRGARIFDFEGVYDERFSEATKSWKGFSIFKEGFGGEKISYIESFTK